jgi:hypothetical protein
MTHSVPVELTDMRFNEKMKPRRYTEEDKQFLRDNYDSMTNRQLSEKMGRSVASVTGTLFRLGLERQQGNGFKRGLPVENINPLTEAGRFLLDFSDHPDLYNRLFEEAAKHFRSPQQQALYYIDNGINGSKINIIGPRLELVGKDADRDHQHSGDTAEIN